MPEPELTARRARITGCALHPVHHEPVSIQVLRSEIAAPNNFHGRL
jgi:hypothetical protein